MGACDVNPLNRSYLSSSDEVTTIKMLVLKIIFVIVATMLDQLTTIQAGVMTVAMCGVVYYHFDGVSGFHRIRKLCMVSHASNVGRWMYVVLCCMQGACLCSQIAFHGVIL